MTDDERDAIDDAISDEAHDARLDRRHSFLVTGRRYCTHCERPLNEADPWPPRTCGSDCDARQCPCGESLWSDEEADRGVCDRCYDSAVPKRMTARDREAGRRGWL